MSTTGLPRRGKKRTKYIASATAPICARAQSCPLESERVTDHYDDAPNTWIFGVHVQGELYSSIRVSVLTSECRTSPSADMYSDVLHPELDRGKIIVDPTRFVADPEKAKKFPELPYVTVRLGWVACGHFNADLGLASVRPEHRAFYRRVFLQQTDGRTAIVPGPAQAGRPDGGGLSGYPGKGVSEVPADAFERFRAADAVPAQSASRSLPLESSSCSCERASIVPGRLIPAPGSRRLASADKCRELRPVPIPPDCGVRRVPSPWRHIYKSLTIAIAFRRLTAFDAVAQHLIKVDGTFA